MLKVPKGFFQLSGGELYRKLFIASILKLLADRKEFDCPHIELICGLMVNFVSLR